MLYKETDTFQDNNSCGVGVPVAPFTTITTNALASILNELGSDIEFAREIINTITGNFPADEQRVIQYDNSDSFGVCEWIEAGRIFVGSTWKRDVRLNNYRIAIIKTQPETVVTKRRAVYQRGPKCNYNYGVTSRVFESVEEFNEGAESTVKFVQWVEGSEETTTIPGAVTETFIYHKQRESTTNV